MGFDTRDLLFHAGGDVLERYGVLSRRTTRSEDVPEAVSAAGVRTYMDENGISRQCASGVSRISRLDLDGDGIPESAVLLTSKEAANLVQFNVPGGSETSFELQSLSAVTNLASEHGVRIEEGDTLIAPFGSNWTNDSWFFVATVVVDFDSDDGVERTLFQSKPDADNQILGRKGADGITDVLVEHGGTIETVALDLEFSAGDTIWIAGRLDAGTLYGYGAVPGDVALTSGTDGAGAISFTNTLATVRVGHTASGDHLAGAINLIFGNDGSSADPITDRFNSGDGLALAGDGGWLSKWRGNLVLHVGGNSDGSALQIDTFDGATDFLAQTATGALDCDGVGYVTCAAAAVSGSDELVVWGRVKAGELAGETMLIGQWDGGDDRQWRVALRDSGALRLYLFDGSDARASTVSVTLVEGQEADWYFRFKGDEASNGDKVQSGVAIVDASTQQRGAWTAELLGDSNTPSTIHSPSGGDVALTHAATAVGTSIHDAPIDDHRLGYGAAGSQGSAAQLQAEVVNEASPHLFKHWWNFDGDLTDQIGSLNGTHSGTPTYVDDGRHNIGGFHRFTPTGRVYTNGVKITHGNYAALDGATDAVVEVVLEPVDVAGGNTVVWERGRAGSDGQLTLQSRTNGDLRVFVPASASDTSNYLDVSGVFVNNRPVHVRAVYQGGEAASDRLAVEISTFDKVDGIWSAFAEPSQVIFGTIPTSLLTPSAGTTVTVGGATAGGTVYDAYFDRVAFTAGSIPAQSTIYEDNSANFAVWADYDGDLTNAGTTGASNDGAASGAIQVADGRKPEGWTVGAGAEIDRATDDATVGTWAARIKNIASSGQVIPIQFTTASATVGRWGVVAGDGRETEPTAQLNMTGGLPVANLPQSGTMTAVGSAAQFTSGGARTVRMLLTAPNDEAYIDNIRAYELATIAASTATKGTAFPSIGGYIGPWGIADAEVVVASAEDIPNPQDDALGTKIVKLTSGPAGSGTRRFLFGNPGDLNGQTVDTVGGMIVKVFIPKTSEIAVDEVDLVARDDVGTTTGDSPVAKGRWCPLWVGRLWDAGATEALFELRFADDVDIAEADEVMYMALPSALAGSVPVAPIPQDDESQVTEVAETISFAYYHRPQAAAAWGDCYPFDLADNGGTPRFFSTGDDTGAEWAVYLDDTTKRLYVRHDNGTDEVTSYVDLSSATSGLRVRWMATIDGDGAVQMFAKIGAGSLLSGVKSLDNELADEWGAELVYVGASLSGNQLNAAHRSLKIVRSLNYTFAEIEAAQ